uniref:Uncharacterized protein n=1 Tax=Molossus molossus TaxID=27622 RepID=A0A7J8CZA7_MOLMO|nr:hypothetical protein HJG59_009477 [Molossus molossus]
MDGAGSPESCLPSLEGKFALDCPEPPPHGAGGGAVYICTYSVPQSSFLHLASTAQAREGERPCQSGPTPAPECSTPPCQPGLWPQCVPHPRAPGGQRAGRGSWGCLILLIGFNFSFAFFSSGPWWSPGLGKRTDLCSYFHTFPVQSGVGALHPYPHHPSPPACWGSVCMFPSMWWEIV